MIKILEEQMNTNRQKERIAKLTIFPEVADVFEKNL